MSVLVQIPNNFTEDWSEGFVKRWKSTVPGTPTIVNHSGKNWLRLSNLNHPEAVSDDGTSYVYRVIPKFMLGTDSDFTVTASFIYNWNPGSVPGDYDAFDIYQGEQKYAGLYCSGSYGSGWFSYNLSGLNGSVDLHDLPPWVQGHEYGYKYEFTAATGTTLQYIKDCTLGGDYVLVGTHVQNWGGPVGFWISNLVRSGYGWQTDIGPISVIRNAPTTIAAGAYDYVPWLPRVVQYGSEVGAIGTDEWESSTWNGVLDPPWSAVKTNVAWTLDYHFDGSKTPGGLVPTYHLDFANVYEAPYENAPWQVVTPEITSNNGQWHEIRLWGTQRYGFAKVSVLYSSGTVVPDNIIPGNGAGFAPADHLTPLVVDISGVAQSDTIKLKVFGDWGTTAQEKTDNYNLYNATRGVSNPRLLPATLHGFTVTYADITGDSALISSDFSTGELQGNIVAGPALISSAMESGFLFRPLEGEDFVVGSFADSGELQGNLLAAAASIPLTAEDGGLTGLLQGAASAIESFAEGAVLQGELSTDSLSLFGVLGEGGLSGNLAADSLLIEMAGETAALSGELEAHPATISLQAEQGTLAGLSGEGSIRSPNGAAISLRAISGQPLTIRSYRDGNWQ